MSMKRKTSSLAAITVAAVVLSGCTTAPAEESPDGEGVLTIFTQPIARDAFEQIVADFEAANTGIEVQLNFAETDSMISTLRTQLSAGTAPDVFAAWPGNGTPASMEVLVPGGYLADLSEMEFSSQLPSGVDPVSQIDGKRYILPMTLGAIAAIYNEQAVAEANAQIPTTWSELLGFCAAARSAGKVGFALGAQDLWMTQLINYALTPTLVYRADPDFVAKMAAGQASFADSGWRTSFEKYLEMRDAGCFQESPLGTGYEQVKSLVVNGEALAVISVTPTLAALQNEAPAGTTFHTFAVPATDNAEETWMPVAVSGAYAINADAKNPVAARKFLDFLASPAAMASFAAAAGGLPTIADGTAEVDPGLQVVVDYLEAGKASPYPDQQWPNAKVQAAHFEGVQKALGDQDSIDNVLKAMDLAYQD